MFPIVGFNSPAFELEGPEEVIAAYESMLGGVAGVVAIQAVTATVAAPIIAEWFLVQTILFLSFYWLVAVWVMVVVFRVGNSFCLELSKVRMGRSLL